MATTSPRAATRPTRATAGALHTYIQAAPFLPLLFDEEDIAFWATDTEQFLLFDFYGRFEIQLKPGDSLNPQGTPAMALREQRRIVRVVPPEVYGFSCWTVAQPVPGGVIGLSYSVDATVRLQQSVGTAREDLGLVDAASAAIAGDADAIQGLMAETHRLLATTSAAVQRADAVSKQMKDIAYRSRFIALNAQIEANRAGLEGRAFGVVANEMQALSQITTTTVGDVRLALKEMQEAVETVGAHLATVEACTSQQSEATQAIRGTITKLAEVVDEMDRWSQQL